MALRSDLSLEFALNRTLTRNQRPDKSLVDDSMPLSLSELSAGEKPSQGLSAA
jgi:hypothetical protein